MLHLMEMGYSLAEVVQLLDLWVPVQFELLLTTGDLLNKSLVNTFSQSSIKIWTVYSEILTY